jgi:hypothetical protein
MGQEPSLTLHQQIGASEKFTMEDGMRKRASRTTESVEVKEMDLARLERIVSLADSDFKVTNGDFFISGSGVDRALFVNSAGMTFEFAVNTNTWPQQCAIHFEELYRHGRYHSAKDVGENSPMLICSGRESDEAIAERMKNEYLPKCRRIFNKCLQTAERMQEMEVDKRSYRGRMPIEVLVSEKVFDQLLHLDRTLVGTENYMGLMYFWHPDYKHTLRAATAKYRVKIHEAFRAAGLAVDGNSPEHHAILVKHQPRKCDVVFANREEAQKWVASKWRW